MPKSQWDKLVDRFWAKVDKNGPIHPIHGQCWEWIGAKNSHGYGALWGLYDYTSAHKLSMEMSGTEVPYGLCVLHKCDNPACVNPDHLFIGTKADNNRDMADKGRCGVGDRHGSKTHPEQVPRGEKNGSSILTEPEVLEIRALYDGGGYSQRTLAKIFGVKKHAVQRVVERSSWTHI